MLEKWSVSGKPHKAAIRQGEDGVWNHFRGEWEGHKCAQGEKK